MDSKLELLKKKKSFEEKLKDPKFAKYKSKFEDGIKMVEKKIEALGKDVVKEVEKVVKKPKTTKKPIAKKKTAKKVKISKDEEVNAIADLKKKTGKTEQECEAIIDQYKALRSKAQTRKKKESESSKKDKERVETLKKKGDIIEGTNVKTADATIETAKKEVVEKIEKEVEVVQEKAEKKAEKEVKKEMPKATKTEQKKEVAKKVEKEVKAKTKTIVKRIIIDTSDLINTISDKLGKLDKDSQKEFLIKLRSDVDKLLSKYEFGGLTNGATQTMNVAQSNLSASSVNPTLFEQGGDTSSLPIMARGGKTHTMPDGSTMLNSDHYAKGGKTHTMPDGSTFLLKDYGYKGKKGDEILVVRTDRDLDVVVGSPIDKSKMNKFQKEQVFEYKISDTSVLPILEKGGSIDSPSIYVADLEAYNNGVLKGEFLDLDDYSDADELMDAIQEVVGEDNEYAIHDYENLPSRMYSEYMGREDFEKIYEAMELSERNGLPFDVVIDVTSEYGEGVVDSYQGSYKDMEDFAYELAEEIGGISNFNNPQYYVYMSDTDRRLTAQDFTDSYLDDIRNEDGGRRIVEEADMDTDAFDDASEDEKEEMVDEAYNMLSERMYDEIYDELDDPYDYFVEQQGMYSREDFFNSNIVSINYEALARDLEQDYISIDGDDGMVYIFSNNYAKGGRIKKGKRSKHSYMQDRRRISKQSWEVAYQKRKNKK